MTNPLAGRADKFLYEFDAFRVDPVRRRLLRDGEPVPLTPKAFAILMVLIENRGGVVDKEDLIQRVWPDAYVTEANLTQNVSSLRKALGERANEHRYVVTIPGHGYRFVAEVLEIPRDPTGEFSVVTAGALQPPATPAELGVAGEAPLASLAAGVPSSIHNGRRRFLVAGLVLGLLFALGLVALLRPLQEARSRAADSPPGERGNGQVRPAGLRPTVAVLGFRNLSGQPEQNWLAAALAEMLISELSAGYKVRIVSGEEIVRIRANFSLPYSDELSDDDLRQVHDLLGADLVVVGSYLALEERGTSRIRIDLRVLQAPAGDTVASVAEVGTEDNLFELVTAVGGKLRRAQGWTAPSVEEARAAQALQPANPEAARFYVEGLTRLRAFDSRGARDLLEQAAQADPNSAVIRSALSLAWIGLGYDAPALREAEKAVQLSAALPKAERLAIQARFQEARNDWSRASEIYRSLWTFYPDNLEYGLRLANSLSVAGRNGQAKATLVSLRQLPPPLRDDPRIDLVAAQIARRLGNPGDELAAGTIAADKGRRLGQGQVLAEALLLQGDALFTMGRPEDSVVRFRRAQSLFNGAGNNAALARTLNRIGAVLLGTGDLVGAEEHYRLALATARRLGSKELAATQTMALAWVAAELGDLQRSRSLAAHAHAQFVELGEHLYATRSLFRLGETFWEMGETEEARRRFEEVLERARGSGNQVEESRALDGLGRALAYAGLLREARSRQERAVQIGRSSGGSYLAASYQASLGQTLIRQGDLAAAHRSLESALAIKRRVRDRLGTAYALGALSGLAYVQGDLALARRYTAEQRSLAELIQASLASAAALQREGRLDIGVGDLRTAREHLSEALRLTSSRGATLRAAELRLDLARLALLERQPHEATRLASEVADWYGARGLHAYRARALALVAQALFGEGRVAPAREAADQAHAIAEKSEDIELRIEVVTVIAPVSVGAGEAAEALANLRRAIGEADRVGFVTAGLEARLALGALLLKAGDPIAAQATLEEVRRAAAARGLTGLARRSAGLLLHPQVPLG